MSCSLFFVAVAQAIVSLFMNHYSKLFEGPGSAGAFFLKKKQDRPGGFCKQKSCSALVFCLAAHPDGKYFALTLGKQGDSAMVFFLMCCFHY
jgi:hypothetical protein